ncbi:hypothetical protein RhiXN_00971 [Rhizoctonia solani]|uniref:Small EDRK-rich factor-like N-terminal domain-containing protein n=1 Tax=Rhizoctonia solani TaxID=456999 RepID=A0A8H8NUH7_9AGAM|nr:uncharacterized protein RhiXN_00971 [Rhizoctonia solani]QRW19565.1 hypothetical protein RhiXN_00971 [Rhizoctonia solani]
MNSKFGEIAIASTLDWTETRMRLADSTEVTSHISTMPDACRLELFSNIGFFKQSVYALGLRCRRQNHVEMASRSTRMLCTPHIKITGCLHPSSALPLLGTPVLDANPGTNGALSSPRCDGQVDQLINPSVRSPGAAGSVSMVTTVYLALILACFISHSVMTRGNQRDHDRERAQKKAASQKKPKESGSSLQKRREADADALRQKQLKKAAEKAAGDGGGGK